MQMARGKFLQLKNIENVLMDEDDSVDDDMENGDAFKLSPPIECAQYTHLYGSLSSSVTKFK